MPKIFTALMLLNIVSVNFFGQLNFALPVDPENPILVPIPSYYRVPTQSLSQNAEALSIQLYSNQMGKIAGRNNAEALETIYLRINELTQQLELAGTNLDSTPPTYSYKFSYKGFIDSTDVSYSWRKARTEVEIMYLKTVLPDAE